METFLPYKLNRADRDRDASKVLTLGPFSWVLKYIFLEASSYRKDFHWDPEKFVFRGA
jgi:hypothetical protein